MANREVLFKELEVGEEFLYCGVRFIKLPRLLFTQEGHEVNAMKLGGGSKFGELGGVICFVDALVHPCRTIAE